MAHWSSCSTNNGPAIPPGPCDCGNNAPEPKPMGEVIPFRPKRLSGFLKDADTAPSETNPDSGDCA
jgi:hypothetical protein